MREPDLVFGVRQLHLEKMASKLWNNIIASADGYPFTVLRAGLRGTQGRQSGAFWRGKLPRRVLEGLFWIHERFSPSKLHQLDQQG
jgi:hypothetical protein